MNDEVYKSQQVVIDSWKTMYYEMKSLNGQLENRITELEEINKQHQELNKELREELENSCWDEASVRADVLLEQQDYEERCQKAIKYINCNKQKTIGAYGDNEDDDFEICLWEEDIDNLLNMLQGSDNE